MSIDIHEDYNDATRRAILIICNDARFKDIIDIWIHMDRLSQPYDDCVKDFGAAIFDMFECEILIGINHNVFCRSIALEFSSMVNWYDVAAFLIARHDDEQ